MVKFIRGDYEIVRYYAYTHSSTNKHVQVLPVELNYYYMNLPLLQASCSTQLRRLQRVQRWAEKKETNLKLITNIAFNAYVLSVVWIYRVFSKLIKKNVI